MLDDHIKTVCKIGRGAECCKYLLLGAEGFQCAKIDSENKDMIDRHWAITEHVAQGDNCEGAILKNEASDKTGKVEIHK